MIRAATPRLTQRATVTPLRPAKSSKVDAMMLPPSSGIIGTRFKTPQPRLTKTNVQARKLVKLPMRSMGMPMTIATTRIAPPAAMPTAGPAKLTRMLLPGVSSRPAESQLVNPPKP